MRRMTMIGKTTRPALENFQECVNLGKLIYTTKPELYNLLGIGTCIGIFMYDLKSRNFTLAHTLLPKYEINEARLNPKMPAKYTDLAIHRMVKKMNQKGSDLKDLKCKIAGGSQIYNDNFLIGQRNIEMTKLVLKDLNIPIVAEDVGGNTSRSILSFNSNGTMHLRKKGIFFTI
jgi:chemotaxis protein CheD